MIHTVYLIIMYYLLEKRTYHILYMYNFYYFLILGSVTKSFNSRASKRFETKDLEDDAVHYYYYRSLPRLNPQEYIPSITSSVENIEPPKLPKLNRKPDLLI